MVSGNAKQGLGRSAGAQHTAGTCHSIFPALALQFGHHRVPPWWHSPSGSSATVLPEVTKQRGSKGEPASGPLWVRARLKRAPSACSLMHLHGN